MAIGFVLIRCVPGREHEVHRLLLAVHDVVELHALFGEHDFLAKVEAPDFDSLSRVIVGRLRAIPGVAGTKTLTGAPL